MGEWRTTRVKTLFGNMEVCVTDGTHAYVSTESGGSIEVGGKPYIVGARFALGEDGWQYQSEGWGHEPVARRDWTSYHKRGAAPTIAAKVLVQALQAVLTVVQASPDILARAHEARARERLRVALLRVEELREQLAEAEYVAEDAEAMLALARVP